MIVSFVSRTPPPVQLAALYFQNDPEVTFTPVEVFVKEDSSSEEEDGGVHGAVACWDSDSDTSVFSSQKSEENVTSSRESLERNETQLERDLHCAQLEEQVAELQAETQRLSKALVRQERTRGKLAQAKRENLLLQQQLAKAESQVLVQEEAARAAQAQLKRERRESFEMMEELMGENMELREQISKLESKTAETEAAVRGLQQELKDKAVSVENVELLEIMDVDSEHVVTQVQCDLVQTLQKLALSDAALEDSALSIKHLEEDKRCLERGLNWTRQKLQETEELYLQSKRCVHNLRSSLKQREVQETEGRTGRVRHLLGQLRAGGPRRGVGAQPSRSAAQRTKPKSSGYLAKPWRPT
ncbi:ankyrin repeat domain-containing protein 26 isoform X1 [Amia ocellicauda]|uniref:ankyrin repeat domain-containing protein 26 isoform X1 n=1 Tax=Amia ocellicauda TaxID=2972642 RepID=UPI00346479B5